MQALEKQVESKVQLWSLVGPCCIIFSILFLYIRPDANDLYLPYASLIGIPLCWKWKIRGLAVSLGILAALMVYHWSSIEPDALLGEIGICTTFALGFLITALSFDEVLDPLKSFQVQTDAQTVEIAQLRESLKTYTDSAESYEKLVGMARQELLSLSRDNEMIKGDLIEQRQKLELSAEQALAKHKQEQTHQLRLHHENERKSDALLKQTQERLEQAYSQIQSLEQALAAAQDSFQTRIDPLQCENAKLQEEVQQRAQAQDMSHDRYEGLYKQLREQFEEKSKVLDDTRKALFHAEEQCERHKHETLEKFQFEASEAEKKLEKYILEMENNFCQKEEQLLNEIDALHAVISTLSSSQNT